MPRQSFKSVPTNRPDFNARRPIDNGGTLNTDGNRLNTWERQQADNPVSERANDSVNDIDDTLAEADARNNVDTPQPEYEDLPDYQDTNEQFSDDYDVDPEDRSSRFGGGLPDLRRKEKDIDKPAEKDASPTQREKHGLGYGEHNPESAPDRGRPKSLRYRPDTASAATGAAAGAAKKGIKTPSGRPTPLYLWNAYRKQGIAGLIVAILILMLFNFGLPSLPNFQLDLLNKHRKDTSRNRDHDKDKKNARHRKMTEAYAKKALADDIQACGSLANQNCLKERAKARKDNADFWPEGKVGDMMRSWDESGQKIDELHRTGLKIEFRGGQFHVEGPDGKKYQMSQAQFAGEWGDEFKMTMRVVDVDGQKLSFRDYFREVSLRKFAGEKWGGRFCINFCKPEEAKEATRDDPKKSPEENQKNKHKAFADVRDAELDTRTQPDDMLPKVFECLMEPGCQNNEAADEKAEEIKDEHKKRLQAAEAGFEDKKKRGEELNGDDPVKGKASKTFKLFEKLERKITAKLTTGGIPIIGQLMTVVRIYDTITQYADAALDPNNKSWMIIRNAVLGMMFTQAANYIDTMVSEAKAVPDKDFAVEASLAAIGTGGALEGWEKSDLFQLTQGSRVAEQTNEQILDDSFRMDKPPEVKNFFTEATGDSVAVAAIVGVMGIADPEDFFGYTQCVLGLVIPSPGSLCGIVNAVRAFDWTVEKLFGLVEYILPPSLANYLIQEYLIPLLIPFINEAMAWMLDLPWSNLAEATGEKLYQGGVVGEDLLNYGNILAAGGRELTPAEALASLNEANIDRAIAQRQAPLSERLFATDNPNSLFGAVITRSPVAHINTPRDFVAAINPFFLFANVFKAAAPANAVNINAMTSSELTGIPDVGVGQECIDRDPLAPLPPANEDRELDERDAIGGKKTAQDCTLFDEEVAKDGSGLSDEINAKGGGEEE